MFESIPTDLRRPLESVKRDRVLFLLGPGAFSTQGRYADGYSRCRDFLFAGLAALAAECRQCGLAELTASFDADRRRLMKIA